LVIRNDYRNKISEKALKNKIKLEKKNQAENPQDNFQEKLNEVILLHKGEINQRIKEDNKYLESIANQVLIAAEITEIVKKHLNKETGRNDFVLKEELLEYLNRVVITIAFKPPMVIKPKQ